MSEAQIISKSTPLLVEERIEPVLTFWQRLGVSAVTQVPESEEPGARLGFVILAGPGIEVMYQTVTSMATDMVAASTDRGAYQSKSQQGYLFIVVPSLAEIERRLKGERLVMPHRTTFYGAKELGYADPVGNIVTFAEFPPKA